MPTLSLSLLAALSTMNTPQANDLSAFDGVWVYVEDRTEGRALEELGPPMSSTFAFKSEPGTIILDYGHGSGHRNVKIKLDGTVTEVPGETAGASARYTASWKGGVLKTEVGFVRTADTEPEGQIYREFSLTPDGLVVKASSARFPAQSVGLYRHPQDIAMPTPFRAKIDDMSWLSGNWSGSRGTNGSITFEERWSPAKGGSMLAISRTFSRDRLGAFEYLRILEKDGGLVYVAQPNGAAPTEFVLTELKDNRAVFDNPRHDYPKRIVYELSKDGGLTATIGFMKGGTPRKFEFKREGD